MWKSENSPRLRACKPVGDSGPTPGRSGGHLRALSEGVSGESLWHTVLFAGPGGVISPDVDGPLCALYLVVMTL